jgi:hypothetical protein
MRRIPRKRSRCTRRSRRPALRATPGLGCRSYWPGSQAYGRLRSLGWTDTERTNLSRWVAVAEPAAWPPRGSGDSYPGRRNWGRPWVRRTSSPGVSSPLRASGLPTSPWGRHPRKSSRRSGPRSPRTVARASSTGPCTPGTSWIWETVPASSTGNASGRARSNSTRGRFAQPCCVRPCAMNNGPSPLSRRNAPSSAGFGDWSTAESSPGIGPPACCTSRRAD